MSGEVRTLRGEHEAVIERRLLETGGVEIPLNADDPRLRMSLQVARALVRQISRRHGRPYRTYRAPGDVLLVAEWPDWPRDARERELQEAATRRAAEAAEASLARLLPQDRHGDGDKS